MLVSVKTIIFNIVWQIEVTLRYKSTLHSCSDASHLLWHLPLVELLSAEGW